MNYGHGHELQGREMILVGLTGGIACGKSTVAELFKKSSCHIIDADLISRRVVEPGEKAWKGIVDHFGKEVLNENGTIHRKRLGEIVFEDRGKLKLLNSIVHPEVYRKTLENIKQIKDKNAIVILDAALLIEAGIHKDMDKTVVVYVDPQTQLKRLMERDGLTAEEAGKRLEAQMPIQEKIKYADYIIDNSGSLQKTKGEVGKVLNILKKTIDKRKRVSYI